MDNLMIFAQKSTKEKQPPVRGWNSLQGTPVEQVERLHKEQAWKPLNGLSVKEIRSKQIQLISELLLEIGALLIKEETAGWGSYTGLHFGCPDWFGQG